MPDFEARAVIDDLDREVQVRPGDVSGEVWLRIPEGLDGDREVLVDRVKLANAMEWVDQENPRGGDGE
jgi:hypothetical protein